MTSLYQPLESNVTICDTTSSAQTSYSTISAIDTITLSGSSTLSTSYPAHTYSIGAGSTITSGLGLTVGSISISTSGSEFVWNTPQEFVNSWPSYQRIQDMCEEYPGLKLAFEKFVTTYKLVKDHYDTPEDQRPRP